MSNVRFHDQIKPEGMGRIWFWGDEDDGCGCGFSLPLAPIDDQPFTDLKDTSATQLFIDSAKFLKIDFEDSDELHGRTAMIEVPDSNDWAKHGSHYICCCHNPITLRRMDFQVLDCDHMRVHVALTVHYSIHGLGDDLDLELTPTFYVEGDEEEGEHDSGLNGIQP